MKSAYVFVMISVQDLLIAPRPILRSLGACDSGSNVSVSVRDLIQLSTAVCN